MPNSALTIGITGGIGSGKSYVASLLTTHFDIPVYDSDREAKRLIAESDAIRRALTRLVGPEVYADGALQKDVLARYLFESREHARRVNAIVHPAVIADFVAWRGRQTKPNVALESALLYESGLAPYAAVVLFVDAPLPLRLERACQRDHTTPEQVEARIAQQNTNIPRRRAQFVLTNDGLQPVLPQLQTFINQIDPD